MPYCYGSRWRGAWKEKNVPWVYELVDQYDAEQGLTAMKRCTGFAVSAVACLLASKQVPGGGAAPPEQVIPKIPFLAAIKAKGLQIDEVWQ